MPTLDSRSVVDRIFAAFAVAGHKDYGERVSMQDHMLQAAALAEADGADDQTVVAALLHDFGHLVTDAPNDIFSKGENNAHESVGADALADWFDERVVTAIRLHVDAKRYLCATDAGYLDELSPASIMTLALQGGVMDEVEILQFEQTPGHEMAIRVRRYDDQGKCDQSAFPSLEHYRSKLERCLRSAEDVA